MLSNNRQHCCRVMGDIEKNVDNGWKSVVINFKFDSDTVKVLLKLRCEKIFTAERILSSNTLLQLMPKNYRMGAFKNTD